MIYEKKYKDISCFAEYKDRYFAVSGTTNQMYVLEKKSQRIIDTIFFHKEQSNIKNLFGQCFLYDKNLILVPENANHLIIYDLKKCETIYLAVVENFLQAVRTNSEILFLMGAKTGNLYTLHIKNQIIRFEKKIEYV